MPISFVLLIFQHYLHSGIEGDRCKQPDLGDKNIEASMLVVPPELVAAVFCTEGLAVVLNVLEERVILGGSP